MDERRFGLGLAVGVLLGVAIVAASGGLAAAQLMRLPASTNEKALTTTLTQTTTVRSPQTSVPTGTNGTQGLQVTPSNATTGNSAATNAFLFSVSSIQAALPSTSFAAIASQSPASNALLIVPVAVALLLGAFVYRIYAKRKTADEED